VNLIFTLHARAARKMPRERKFQCRHAAGKPVIRILFGVHELEDRRILQIARRGKRRLVPAQHNLFLRLGGDANRPSEVRIWAFKP